MSKRTIVKGIQVYLPGLNYSSFKDSFRNGNEFICVSSISDPIVRPMNLGDKLCVSFKYGARKRLLKGLLSNHPVLGYIVVASS